nr:hypothetical protein [Citrobacter portucalensis]UVY98729.1 hypothetical protein [Citrobacter freundii]
MIHTVMMAFEPTTSIKDHITLVFLVTENSSSIVEAAPIIPTTYKCAA